MSAHFCGACGAENPPGAKFCMSCGASQGATCPGCGAKGDIGARFCVECGTPYDAATAGAATEQVSVPASDEPELSEERRKATVLFADLSGYTAIAEKLDPEDTKALVDNALKRLSREVVDRGGRVDKYIGDNVMAVFGAPVAHEDDPERAVRTGLAMQAAMEEVNADIAARAASKDVKLSLRVGINSGEVLAGKMGEQYTVIGDTVNVASRLEASGRPGAVTVGPLTHRLTAGTIDYVELEPLQLKGKSEPIPAWEAVAATGVARRERSTSRPAVPLIGREYEFGMLKALFERVSRDPRPHLVTVFGQAGVGKTRLLTELVKELHDGEQEVTALVGRSPAYEAGTAYWALGQIMREWFEIADDEESAAALEKLTRGIEKLRTSPEIDPARSAVLIGRLLGFDLREDRDALEDPEEVRERIFAAVRSVFQLISERRPLLIAVEDIHWADDGTLDLIEHLAGVGRGRMLIVCMTRDELLERRPGWGGGRRNATTITLEPLTPEETEQLVRTLFDDADESGIAAEVAGRSGGNPLFAEEIVNRLNEEGSDSIDELPDSVHAVLAARLDSLDGEERRLIQAASVVGQSFWEQTVAELSGGGAIAKPLATLVEKDLLVPATSSRLADEREFAFKHALVRDVAYSKLPRAIRARKHFEVASIVERRSEGNGDTTAGLLAEHYGRAATLGEQSDFPDEELTEMRLRAGGAYERAGDVAASLYSNGEALGMYSNALQLGEGLSAEIRARVEEKRGDTAFRSGQVDAALEAWERALEYQRDNHQRERAGGLHRKIGSGLWHKGSREASIAQFQQGIDLLKDGDACSELVELYEEAASLYVETGDNMLAIYAAEKAQRLAEDLGESSTASRAHLTFGRVFGRIGDLEQARRSLERSVELAREASPSEAVRALLALGRHLEVAEADYPAAATTCREALELANQLGDVPAQIELHAALGQLAVNSASWSEVELHAKASAELAEREGLSGQLCLPLLLRGICAWRNGNWEEADEHLRRSHDIAAAGGRSETAFSALLWLATCERDRGNLESAREALVQAADICERAGLIAQSVEATGALAGVLALQGRSQEATAAAEEVERLGSRGGHPVGKAAAAEARGAVLEDPEAAISELRTAAKEWEGAGRPLNALRTRLLLAQRLGEESPAAAAEELGEIATAAGRLEVPHLAAAARSLVPG